MRVSELGAGAPIFSRKGRVCFLPVIILLLQDLYSGHSGPTQGLKVKFLQKECCSRRSFTVKIFINHGDKA